MPCEASGLRHVPLFPLFDDDLLAVLNAHAILAVLAALAEPRHFAPRQRNNKPGIPGDRADTLISSTRLSASSKENGCLRRLRRHPLVF
jgi:hypothetical protein